MRARVSLRAAPRVLALVADLFGLPLPNFSRTTGRRWLLRIGLAELLQPKEQANDWMWLLDFSVQIGKAKCLVIFAVRLAHLPPQGQCLRHEHLRLIHLALLEDANKRSVLRHLKVAAKKTGNPRGILSDHGADVHGGIRLFVRQHPKTSAIYDITHKGACLLKHRLENDQRWCEFGRLAGQAKVAMQQTELAALVPPNQRSKSRYMNLGTLLVWGKKALALLSQPSLAEAAGINSEQLPGKLGWLATYREALQEWSEWHELVMATEKVVRHEGLAASTVEKVVKELTGIAQLETGVELANELIMFVAGQVAKLRAGERMPGTTEVVESCFGKLKAVEEDQAKNGFTSLLLTLGAMVGKQTEMDVQKALEKYPDKVVNRWCAQNLGITVQTQRRRVYQACDANASDQPETQA